MNTSLHKLPTALASTAGREESNLSMRKKVGHEPKKKNQRHDGGGVLVGWVNSTSTQLYVCPHRKLLGDRLVQAAANLCAGFMFVTYIFIYIYI